MKIERNQQQTEMLFQCIADLKIIKSVQTDQSVMDTLSFVETRLSDETFRIAVVGEFSSGKSTFINAIIGRDILSHAVTETTAAITYITNVPKDDIRNGTAKVKYRNGEVKELQDLDDLVNYTTVQSGKNVALEVENVSIFVNFLATDFPVVITDTPGLNGIAEHHKEITVNEVKKAHACIYLLSKNGIKNSDTSFIKLLLESQNTFFFLQNFKDSLSSSEGDTIEGKLEEAENNIAKKIVPETKEFTRHIMGISALKALAAKDHSIKRLYADDTEDLQDADREILLEESGLLDFENALAEMVNSGEYLNIIYGSCKEIIRELLEFLLSEMERQQILNEDLRENSEEARRMESAQRLKESIEESRNEREVRLQNFITARSDEQQRLLREHTNEMVHDLYERFCVEIDEDFKKLFSAEVSEKTLSYDALFRTMKGKDASEYYTKRASDEVNEKIVKDNTDTICIFLNHLYEEAVSKVMNYTRVKPAKQHMDLHISAPKDKFQMDSKSVNDHESRVKAIEQSVSACQKKIEAFTQEVHKLKGDSDHTQHELNAAISRKNTLEKSCQSELSSLGRKPPVREYEESETKKVPRSGLFGGLRTLIQGEKTITVTRTKTDDSEQRAWESKYRRISSAYSQKIEGVREQINELQADLSYYSDSVQQTEKRIASLRNELQALNDEKIHEDKLYGTLMQAAKRKFLEYQKNNIKKNLEIQLFDNGETNNVTAWCYATIKKLYNQYLPDITNCMLQAYRDSVQQRIAEIDQMVKENAETLEKRFQCNEEDMASLQAIYQNIMSD